MSVDNIPRITEQVQIDMSDRQEKALRRIDAEDMDMVIYLTRKELQEKGRKSPPSFLSSILRLFRGRPSHGPRGPTDDIDYYERGVLALKQYYALTLFDPKNMHAISEELDPFWHAHVLDTVAYEELCDDIGGFMHHDPLNEFDTRKVEAISEIYDYTREALERIFGADNLDPEFHPINPPDSRMVCRHDIDLMSEEFPDDVFDLEEDLAEYRIQYSNEARREIIHEGLEEEFSIAQ